MFFLYELLRSFWKIPKFIIGTLVKYTLVKILVNWPLDTFIHVFCIVFIQLICFLIRDLAKICWGIRENANHIERKRDLTATREAGFTKIWARDVRLFFFPLSIRNSVNRKMRNRQMWINRFVIWRGYEKLCQNNKRIKRANLRVN